MFDVALQELALIFGVALVVLGPKKLSSLVSTVGRWVGKARVMARDFRQQLEHEVNLDELNKFTDLQSSSSQGSTMPPPPPEFTGEPVADAPPADTPPVAAADEPAAPSYPYAAPDSPSPADDTYSHAHAQGDAPTPWSEEPAPHADAGEPSQASLDLEAPEDLSHLPPDDARRNA